MARHGVARGAWLGTAAFLLLGGAASAEVVIDDFAGTPGDIALSTPCGRNGASRAAASAIGGFRDVVVTARSEDCGGPSVAAQTTATTVDFLIGGVVPGELLGSWDGAHDGSDGSLDPAGLGGVDLGAGGANAVRVRVASSTMETTVLVEVFTSATASSVQAARIPVVGTPTDLVLPFADFVANRGAGAAFDSVGAVRLFIRGSDGALVLDDVRTVDATPAVSASKTASPASVGAGEALDYTITLTNPGSTASDVHLGDTLDANVTLVPGSVEVSPIARNDVFSSTTTPATVAAPGVLANDNDPDGDTLSISAFDATSAEGGTVVLAADGSFTYTPLASQLTGPDTFGYTITDGNGIPDQALVTVTIVDDAPTVTDTTPDDDATGVPANTNITITFSEPVSASAASFTVLCGTSGSHTVVVTGGPTTFTLDPEVDFGGGETCTVTVLANQVQDEDVIDPPDGLAADFVFDFTTDAAPDLLSSVPVDDATQVAADTNIALTFTEAVDLAAGWLLIDCTVSADRTDADVAVSGGPTTWTVNPNTDFTAGESCTVTVNHLMVTDQDSGDPPDTMAQDRSFDFTIDEAPSVQSTVPANGATDISPATNITITFSEPVDVTGNWFQIVCGAQTKNPGDTAVTGGPTTFTINPTTDLLAGNICQVTVFAAQVTDQDAGDPPDAMAANHVFSFSVPPQAVADNYKDADGDPDADPTVVGNVGVNTDNSTEFSILANDIPSTGVTINLPGGGTTIAGGSVTVAATGKFSYTPPPGFEGADTFSYNISNAAGTSPNVNVTISVAGMIWFVNNGGPAGDGRLGTPFNSLAAFQAVNNGTGNNPAAGDNVFLFENASAYTGPVTLLASQKLIGQDANQTLAAISGVSVPPDSFALPAMNTGAPATTINFAAAGNAVTLNNLATFDNTVRGMTITTGSSTSVGISGTGFGTLHVGTDLVLSGSGPALVLSSGALSGNFGSISSTGGANNISLTSMGGSSDLGGGALSGATGNAFRVAGGTVGLTYSGTISATAAGARPVNITDKTTSGNVTFLGAVSASGSAAGVNLDNNDGATITFSGGVSLSTGANAGFNGVNGGTVVATQNNTTIVNTITTTTGTALNVANTIIGAAGLTFRSISANGASSGIVLNSTGAAGGLTVTGSSTGLCGGAVSGLPAAITPPNVADCTGGTVQNSTGPGILLQSASNVSLTRVRVTGGQDDGIRGAAVTGFSLVSSLVENNGNAVGEAGLDFGDGGGSYASGFVGMLGNSAITNSTVRGSAEDNVLVRSKDTPPVEASPLVLTVSGSTFRDNSVIGNDGILVESGESSTITVSVTGSAFLAHRGDHFQTAALNSGDLTVRFLSNTLAGGHATALGQGITINAATGVAFGGYTGRVDYDIDGNIINSAILSAITVNLGTSGAAGTFNGFVRNNVIGTVGVPNSGSAQGFGIAVDAHGNGTHTVAVTSNVVREAFDRAISVLANDGNGVLNLTVQSNVLGVGTDPLGSRESFFLNNASTTTNVFGLVDSHTVRLDLGGVGALANTLTHGVGAPDDFRIRQRFDSRIEMPGYGGGPFDTATVVTYVQGRNTGSAGEPGSATANDSVAVTTDGFFAGSVPAPTPF